jgi:hypothetical protein
MNIFQQNKKMNKASVLTFNFALPAINTCPGAGSCKQFCYAALEQIRYPSANGYRNRMFELSKSAEFIPTINGELIRLRKKSKGNKVAIRIHSSGDFYSAEYVLKWTAIAEQNPDIIFYAYTKSVAMFKHIQKNGISLPLNFIIIFSLGGRQDKLIDVNNDRHSRIFASTEQALESGYDLANEDDTVAWSTTNNKIGLVMFGARAKKGNAVLNNVA